VHRLREGLVDPAHEDVELHVVPHRVLVRDVPLWARFVDPTECTLSSRIAGGVAALPSSMRRHHARNI
jgi:hypothetical protein